MAPNVCVRVCVCVLGYAVNALADFGCSPGVIPRRGPFLRICVLRRRLAIGSERARPANCPLPYDLPYAAAHAHTHILLFIRFP